MNIMIINIILIVILWPLGRASGWKSRGRGMAGSRKDGRLPGQAGANSGNYNYNNNHNNNNNS